MGVHPVLLVLQAAPLPGVQEQRVPELRSDRQPNHLALLQRAHQPASTARPPAVPCRALRATKEMINPCLTHLHAISLCLRATKEMMQPCLIHLHAISLCSAAHQVARLDPAVRVGDCIDVPLLQQRRAKVTQPCPGIHCNSTKSTQGPRNSDRTRWTMDHGPWTIGPWTAVAHARASRGRPT